MSDKETQARVPVLLEEREGVWVFMKPAGFAVHPTNDPEIPDLLTWAQEELLLGGAPEELAPIHRLDRETSGLVLCSPDPKVRAKFGRWFAQGDVRKEYLTLVFGRTHRKGVIRRPLHDQRRQRKLPATTRYRQLDRLGAFSYLRAIPESGRKHQLRRHLHSIGHAIVGDQRYRPRKFRPVPAFPGRLWLHAHRLILPNGWEFCAPLSADLQEHLEVLQTRREENRRKTSGENHAS